MVNLADPILKNFRKASTPNVEVGDIVRVHQKIREGNKERVQVFEGIVISLHKRSSLDATFTVRKISYGVGVERTYLLHSPNIVKLEFKRSSKVRRSKLFYLRALTGKALKMKDKKILKDNWTEIVGGTEDAQTEATEADVAEAVAAEEAKAAEQEAGSPEIEVASDQTSEPVQNEGDETAETNEESTDTGAGEAAPSDGDK